MSKLYHVKQGDSVLLRLNAKKGWDRGWVVNFVDHNRLALLLQRSSLFGPDYENIPTDKLHTVAVLASVRDHDAPYCYDYALRHTLGAYRRLRLIYNLHSPDHPYQLLCLDCGKLVQAENRIAVGILTIKDDQWYCSTEFNRDDRERMPPALAHEARCGCRDKVYTHLNRFTYQQQEK